MRSFICALLLLVPLALAGCAEENDAGGNGDPPSDGGAGAGGEPSGGAGGGGGGGGEPVCVPRTCLEVESACGAFSDGCGGTLRCWEACDCGPDDFAARCPSRPCETAVGCSDRGACVYEPVTCGAPCRCALGTCDDATPRSCGDSLCTEQFCLPSPRGDGTYGNVCAPADEAVCGTCGLGRLSCDPAAGTLACDDLGLASDVNPTRVECDSSLGGSTFVFFDPAFAGGGADGSRQAPFTTLPDALDAAATRGARGIVVGGAPVLLERPEFLEGISVYGGYSGWPLWRRDERLRPSWRIPFDGAPGGLFVGVWLEGIRRETVLADLELHTVSLAGRETGAGLSNYGLYVVDSPGLRLHRVEVTSGDASDGGDGAPGLDAPAPSEGLAGAPTSAVREKTACGASVGWFCTYEQAGGDDACRCNFDAASNSCLWATVTEPPQSCLTCPDVGAVPFAAGGDGGLGAGGVNVLGGGYYEVFFWPSTTPIAPSGVPQQGTEDWRWWAHYPALPGLPGPNAPSWAPIQAPSGRAVRTPELRDGLWAFHPASSGRGQQGRAGRAGGGGGGGMGGTGWLGGGWDLTSFIVGSGGGGGGAGACGGGGGLGGHPGGYSVALFVARSEGMVARDCRFVSGRGGRGGGGGPGGGSRAGGLGGPAGGPDPAILPLFDPATCLRPGDGPEEICLVLGAPGGPGGSGQPGAFGGNGAGGSSVGGACVEGGIVLQGETRFLGSTPGDGGAAQGPPGPAGESVTQRGCAASCGNGVLDPGEACDDGNDRPRDGCGLDCSLDCATGSGADRALVDPATGQCLAAFLTPQSGPDAAARCTAIGGALLTVTNPLTAHAASILTEPESAYLIGLSDAAVEGTFAWPDGVVPEALSWCEGEPAGGEAQDCTLHRVDLGCFSNVSCDDFAPFVCALPVP